MNEQTLDDELDRAIRAVLSIPAPADIRMRIIESAVGWRKSRVSWAVVYAVAALALVVIGAGIVMIVSKDRGPATQIANTRQRTAGTDEPVVAATQAAPRIDESPAHAMYAKWSSSVHVQAAEHAPIIVANGGRKPIKLGAAIPQRDAGELLHVWDWTKSSMSAVRPDVVLGEDERILLPPSGKPLLWSGNSLRDLQTGERAAFNVGEMSRRIGSATYRRIGATRFSPTGDRLAMHVAEIDDRQPGRIKSEVVRIVEFPGGKPLGEFPHSDGSVLRVAFSADGKQLVAADRSRQLVLRDATSGKELRRFDPIPDRQFVGVAMSLDKSLVAAYQGSAYSNGLTETKYGDLFIWNAATGALVHRIDGKRLHENRGDGPIYGALRFSPDGKHLAAESWLTILVIDVTSGDVVSSLYQGRFAGTVQWSADGKTLTSVTTLGASEGGGDDGLPPGRYDVYPAVFEWDWRSGKLLRGIPPR